MIHTCSQRRFDEMATALYGSGNTGWILKSRCDPLRQKTSWLEGVVRINVQPSAAAVWVTYYIAYDAVYSRPQLCFSLSTVLDAPVLSAQFSKLRFLHHSCDDGEQKPAPLVSFCFCEEIARSAWKIHSCDTGKLLASAAVDGCTGNVLELFITAISPFLDLPVGLCV